MMQVFLFGTGDKQLSYTNDQELFVQYDVNKNFRIHPQNGLEVNYDGKALGISSEELSYADEGRTYVITPNSLSLTEGDKQLEISESRAYLAIDGQNSLEYASNTLTAIHADRHSHCRPKWKFLIATRTMPWPFLKVE